MNDPTCPTIIPVEVISAWAPPRRSHPVPWLSENIYFDDRHSAIPGHWNWTLFPYMKGVVDAFMDPHCRQIVLSWGTQLGKTTLLTALIAWMGENDPRPSMIAMPNMEMATWHHDDRLMPMLQACPSIARRLAPIKKRRRELVDLGTMLVHYGWSGSTSKMSGRSIFAMFISEINVWDKTKSEEGDKVAMALDRCKAFPNHKVFYEGKPTIRGECRLTPLLEDESDWREWYVPCPHCDHRQVLRRGTAESPGGLKWQRDKKTGKSTPRLALRTAYYECESCHAAINDQHKVLMNRKGEWKAKNGESKDFAGFHLSSLASPTLTFGEYAERFVRSWRGTIGDRQAFVNGWDAVAWETKGMRTGIEDIERHRLEYPQNYVTEEPLAIICTADVSKAKTQVDEGGAVPELRLYYVIRAWGHHGTSWLLRYGELQGLGQLSRVLQETYSGPEKTRYAIGGVYPSVFIDARYQTQQIYYWCAKQKAKAVPIMGRDRHAQAAIVRETNVKFSGGEIALWYVNTDQARDELYENVLAVKLGDPGYWALHNSAGHDYCASLATWQRVEEVVRGKERRIWQPDNPEIEHYGDLEAYQIAAARYHGFAFMEPKIEEEIRRQEKKDFGDRPPFRPPGEPQSEVRQQFKFGRRRDGRTW